MKNKKKVLIAVAAMGLVAAATAGVGTAAWFQVGAAKLKGDSAAAQGSVQVSVNDTPATTLYNATVHLEVEALSDTLTLSSWHTPDAGVEALYTNVVDTAGGSDHWTTDAGTGKTFTTALKVNAWVTNDNSISSDVFNAALLATSEMVTYTFAWKNPTGLTSSQEALVSDELVFYTEKTSGDASAYAASSSAETALTTTAATKQLTLDFAVNSLGVGQENKVQIGYIHLRIEGDPANTSRDTSFAHNKDKVYVGGLEGTGTSFNK